jgi:hypothetical protein
VSEAAKMPGDYDTWLSREPEYTPFGDEDQAADYSPTAQDEADEAAELARVLERQDQESELGD